MSDDEASVLVEHRHGYETRWMCELPPEGVKFTVARDEWSGSPDHPVRTIYEIACTGRHDCRCGHGYHQENAPRKDGI